jgi:hypothetical protein
MVCGTLCEGLFISAKREPCAPGARDYTVMETPHIQGSALSQIIALFSGPTI